MFSLSNISLIPSRSLLLLCCSGHFMLILVSAFYDIHLWQKAVMIALCVCSLIYNLNRHVFLNSPFSITHIHWDTESSHLSLRQMNGQWIDVDRIDSRFICPFAIFLNCKVEQRLLSVPLILWKGCMSDDNYRRLRVLLRYAKLT